MAKAVVDELVSWSLNRRGRVIGFTGLRGDYQLNLLSRFLLPDLGPDFAEKGDLLRLDPVDTLLSEILVPINYTQLRVLSVDRSRALTCAAFIFALPLPSALLGRWWWLIFSGVAAAAFLYFLFASGAASPKIVTEDGAALNLAAWRIIRRDVLPEEDPRFTIRKGPEPDWVALLDRAYAGTLEDHETVELGELPVPDGKLLACEPFLIHEPGRYTIAVPPGVYPVFISIAASPESSDQRIAYAWVKLRDGAPARWEPARTRRGDKVEVGVDSGMAAFVSATSAKAVIEAYRQPGWDYVEPLSEAIVEAMKKLWRDTRGWTMIETEGGARLAAFSSGFGDGTYPVYRALDDRGRRLAVAMHFYVDWS